MRKLSILAAAAALTAGNLAADIQIGKGLTVGGYLDMYFQSADVDTANGDTSGFTAQNAEVDFMMDFGSGLTAQIDLDSSFNSTSNASSNFNVEQARIDYSFGQSTLTFGKFDTFIGLEGLEAPDLYQFSNSLTFAQEPTQHEGVAYAYDAGMWNVAAALVNGISSDNGNGMNNADNDELSYALHIGVVPVESLSLNANYALGQAEAGSGPDLDLSVWTLDASYSNHGWTLGAEYVKTESEVAGAADAELDAFMLMANYMFTEQFGATIRYSQSEVDGAADGDATELTFAASYSITPNWAALIEYRTEETGVGANANGQLASTAGVDADVITLETILTF